MLINLPLNASRYLQLGEQLSNLFNLNANANDIMSAVAIALAKFGKQGVHELISELLVSPSLLAEMAANSYLHKNGFYKLPLYHSDLFSLRLNIWMPSRASKETLHSHRWHIASSIIDGVLHSEIWRDAVDGHALDYPEYLYTDKHSDPICVGSARVKLHEVIKHQAGTHYTLDASVLHRIISKTEQMTATLMCHSAYVKSFARNVIVNQQVPMVQPHYLSVLQLTELLYEYRSMSLKQTDGINV